MSAPTQCLGLFFEKKTPGKSWESQVVEKCTNSILCLCVASRLQDLILYHKMLMLSFFNVCSLRRTWVCHTFHHEPNASQNRLRDLIVSDKANHQLLYRFEVILTYFEECIHHQNQRVVISVSVLELIS